MDVTPIKYYVSPGDIIIMSVLYLATSAYLDNFENIEKSIGKELSDAGEQVLRVQLRGQINNKVSVDQIKQTINEANTVLDKAECILK